MNKGFDREIHHEVLRSAHDALIDPTTRFFMSNRPLLQRHVAGCAGVAVIVSHLEHPYQRVLIVLLDGSLLSRFKISDLGTKGSGSLEQVVLPLGQYKEFINCPSRSVIHSLCWRMLGSSFGVGRFRVKQRIHSLFNLLKKVMPLLSAPSLPWGIVSTDEDDRLGHLG